MTSASSNRLAVQKSGQVIVTVDADIDAIWDVVRDVTRVAEWSHECVGTSWIGEARAPVRGARFRGRNRYGRFRWSRVCEIVAAEPYEFVWRTVPSLGRPDSTEWTIALERNKTATIIEQRFRVTHLPKTVDRLYGLMFRQHRDRTSALTADLRRLGDMATCAPSDGNDEDAVLPDHADPKGS